MKANVDFVKLFTKVQKCFDWNKYMLAFFSIHSIFISSFASSKKIAYVSPCHRMTDDCHSVTGDCQSRDSRQEDVMLSSTNKLSPHCIYACLRSTLHPTSFACYVLIICKLQDVGYLLALH